MKSLLVVLLLASSVAQADRVDDAIRQLEDAISESHRIELKFAEAQCRKFGGGSCARYRQMLEEDRQMLLQLKDQKGVLDEVEKRQK